MASGCAAGERGAVGSWQRYVGAVHRIAAEVHERFGGRIDREDLRQTGLVALLETCARFEPERGATFGRYVRIRVRGAMVDHARREIARTPVLRVAASPGFTCPREEQGPRRRPVVREDDIGALEVLADGREAAATPWRGGRRSMESEVLYRDFVRSLRQRLRRLDRRERAAVRAHDLEGRSFAGVAGRLGISRSATVRARRAGLAQLRAGW